MVFPSPNNNAGVSEASKLKVFQKVKGGGRKVPFFYLTTKEGGEGEGEDCISSYSFSLLLHCYFL